MLMKFFFVIVDRYSPEKDILPYRGSLFLLQRLLLSANNRKHSRKEVIVNLKDCALFDEDHKISAILVYALIAVALNIVQDINIERWCVCPVRDVESEWKLNYL